MKYLRGGLLLCFCLATAFFLNENVAEVYGQTASETSTEIIPVASGPMEMLGRALRERENFIPVITQSKTPWSLVLYFLLAISLLSGFFGFLMGISAGLKQAVTSGWKTPALFLGSLAVCFPILFIVNAFMGSQMELVQTLALVLFALTINALLLAGFAPIVGFFGSGSSYNFMKLLNVAVFAICGVCSMGVLHRALVLVSQQVNAHPQNGAFLFKIWILAYGFVGIQMAWTLRPFLGDPDKPFQVFRKRDPGFNIYMAIMASLRQLLIKRGHIQESATVNIDAKKNN